MEKKDYATQIWPFREAFGKDMPGTLEKIAETGFSGVELCRWFNWTDMFDKWTAAEIQEASKQAALEITGSHVPFFMILKERLDELTEFCGVVGMRFAVVASLPGECFASKAALLETASVFNKAATILGPRGIRIGYHCHGNDFKAVEGAIPWEVLFDNTSPDVIMQLDIGNARQGGADPIYYLKKYPGRATLVHLKEYDPQTPPAAIGDGEIDWPEVMALCENLHQPVWYIIEQEEKLYNPWTSAERSLHYLHSIGW
jgi:sugar phosphate isomerase/epimerase